MKKKSRTHFARFVVLEDPDAGKNRRRLLFTSNYDGSLDAYLDELETVFNHPSGKFNKTAMEEIWERCDLPADRNFKDFVREQTKRHKRKTLFYVGLRGETVAKIKGYIARREKFIQDPDTPHWLEVENVSRKDLLRGGLPLLGTLIGLFFSSSASLGKALRTLEALPLLGEKNGGMPLNPVAQDYSSSIIADCLEEVPCLRDPAPPTGVTLPQANGFGRDNEDVFAQNQMNVVSDIDPSQLAMLKTTMKVINAAVKGATRDASLSGISTIHFARWVRIDNDTRLLFLSNYDGSWENYIGDFTDKAYMGLDAVWMNTQGYPGSRDLTAFKQHIRCRQVQSNYFYSAYPETTVLNVLSDRISGK